MKTDLNVMTINELAKYIEYKHHGCLRANLPKISELLYTVLTTHGQNYRELFEVYSLFGQLSALLEQHLFKEETFLFHRFGHQETSEIAKDILREHDRTRHILTRLKDITNNYKTEESPCSIHEEAFRLLNDVTNDIYIHFYLEESILLKEYVENG